MRDVGHRTNGDGSPIKGDIKIEETRRSDKKRYFTIFYWVSGFSLLISIFALCGAWLYKDLVINNMSIVLGFIGVLATFIVVGNYLQVIEIKNELKNTNRRVDERIEVLKSDLEKQIEKLDNRINKLEDSFESKLYKEINSLRENVNSNFIVQNNNCEDIRDTLNKHNDNVLNLNSRLREIETILKMKNTNE
jgi:hypothetical protein